jgi:hypothetical protein
MHIVFVIPVYRHDTSFSKYELQPFSPDYKGQITYKRHDDEIYESDVNEGL